MNDKVLLAYLAIGSLAKLVTLRYPTPGQQWAAVVEIVGGALAAGLLAHWLLPEADGWVAILFAGVPFLFSALGRWLALGIDLGRIWWMKRNARVLEGNGSKGADAE